MENKAIRCKSLQVGDWIQDEQDSPMQVTSVGERYVSTNFVENGHAMWVFVDRPHGIPLTSDILELNGWHDDEYLGVWTCAKCEFGIFYDIVTRTGFYCTDFKNARLDTVDELQRLLRCCGHEDLADDFKIWPHAHAQKEKKH